MKSKQSYLSCTWEYCKNSLLLQLLNVQSFTHGSVNLIATWSTLCAHRSKLCMNIFNRVKEHALIFLLLNHIGRIRVVRWNRTDLYGDLWRHGCSNGDNFTVGMRVVAGSGRVEWLRGRQITTQSWRKQSSGSERTDHICNFVTAEITKQSKYKPKRWGISWYLQETNWVAANHGTNLTILCMLQIYSASIGLTMKDGCVERGGWRNTMGLKVQAGGWEERNLRVRR